MPNPTIPYLITMHKKMAQHFYHEANEISHKIPPVMETVKKVPEIYKRGK